jgi:hypothetical protein
MMPLRVPMTVDPSLRMKSVAGNKVTDMSRTVMIKTFMIDSLCVFTDNGDQAANEDEIRAVGVVWYDGLRRIEGDQKGFLFSVIVDQALEERPSIERKAQMEPS